MQDRSEWTQDQQEGAAPEKTSGLAIASLVLGLSSFVLICLTGIPAIICGIVALTRIGRPGENAKGQGLAITGIVLGSLGVLLSLVVPIMAGMLLPSLARDRGEARLMKCKHNLRLLGTASIQWIDQYGKGREYPPSLTNIQDDKLITEPDVYVCPSDTIPPPLANGTPCSYECAFDRAGVQFPDRTPSNLPMMWHRDPSIHNGRACVVFFDAHVEVASEEVLQKHLQRLDAYIAEMKGAAPTQDPPSIPSGQTRRGPPKSSP